MKCFKMFVLTIVSFLFLGYINVSAENVATSEELLECLSNGGTCTLTANLDVSDRMVIDTGKTVVLDLNGKTLNLTYTTDNYAVLVKGNLTIQGNGTFTITNDFLAIERCDGSFEIYPFDIVDVISLQSAKRQFLTLEQLSLLIISVFLP